MTAAPELTTRILAARAAQKAAQERYDLAQRDGRFDVVKQAALEFAACTRALEKVLDELPSPKDRGA